MRKKPYVRGMKDVRDIGNNRVISQLVDNQSLSKMWIIFPKILTKVFGYLNISSYLYIYQTTKRYELPS